MNAYLELNDFSEEMDKKGVNSLPLEFNPDDLSPFNDLFVKRDKELTENILKDLTLLFNSDFKFIFESRNIYIHDSDAQGATYIIYKVKIYNERISFFLSIKLVLFYNRIIVRLINLEQNRFDSELIASKVIKELSKRDSGIELEELIQLK